MKAKFYCGRVCDLSARGAYWPNAVSINISWDIPSDHDPHDPFAFSDLSLGHLEWNARRFALLTNVASPDVYVERGDDIVFVSLETENGDGRFEFGGVYSVNGKQTEWGDMFDKKNCARFVQ